MADSLLSRTIYNLRFPLTVGVVFMHNRMGTVMIQGQELNYNQWPVVRYLMNFACEVLPTICVPLFFFISGFLFFYNADFNESTYKRKLKSRYKSLMIPYLIWNFIGFLILLTQIHPRFIPFFPLLQDFRVDISTFLCSFWVIQLPMGTGDFTCPIDGPLWYVRDLIILIVAAPFLYYIIKKIGIGLLVLLGLAWFFTLLKGIGLHELSHQSIFFFPLGAYFGINRLNFVCLIKESRIASFAPYVYIVFVVIDTVWHGMGGGFLISTKSV